jgi:hypothetical protein
MSREQECAMNEDIGVLCNGKRFRPNKKRIVSKREGKHNEIEEIDTGVILYIEGSLHKEEKICHLSLVEENPCSDQTLHCTHDPMCITKY